ncbi:hypothetical protein IVB18_04275 [Bradyrhizobium sp. 186]|uniref:hypothetical protein n=1 Tax=Bradyrhizobium sp. 186 TaxID=2782654 RepID=UPI002001A6A2|nr:hypothetical protein [Bradyrhizobium sp. 186]UPK36606.1 hypothetical protein IVB18_04275 [Bradyrhizobium sp. 186]
MIRAAAFNQGKFPTIAFTNLAKESLGVDLRKLVSALEKQLERDFVPIWGYPAKLRISDKPKPDEWQIVFLDDTDEANALGYHDLTKDGQPVSKVFVKSTIGAGEKISVTTSHELLEMLIDPGAQMWAQDSKGVFYAYEMCDAVEDGEYEIDSIAVSNFVYPSFFESWHKPRSVRFDHLGKVARPFQTLANGYQIVSNGSSAREIFGSRRKERHFREVEVRTMHRSEYRKEIAGKRAGTTTYPGESGAAADTRRPRAAVLHHAGRLLSELAAMVDPLPGDDPFELARRGRQGRVVDPLPGGDPFEL